MNWNIPMVSRIRALSFCQQLRRLDSKSKHLAWLSKDWRNCRRKNLKLFHRNWIGKNSGNIKKERMEYYQLDTIWYKQQWLCQQRIKPIWKFLFDILSRCWNFHTFCSSSGIRDMWTMLCLDSSCQYSFDILKVDFLCRLRMSIPHYYFYIIRKSGNFYQSILPRGRS